MERVSLPAALRFVHLSDVHIRAGAPEVDPNTDVRRQLSRDLATIAPDHRPFTGILFSGDVAYSGSVEQYARASEWLGELTRIVEVPPENVWVVPGNHDIDVNAASDIFNDLQVALRQLPVHELSEKLSAILNNPDEATHLFSRLRNYNEFALQYGCEISATRPYWTERWDMSDGSVVVLRGITSPLISTLRDSEGDNKLVVGEFQVHLNSPEPAIHIAMCHHPPSWLRDWEEVETYLDTRSSVQVFGHRHLANSVVRDRSLRVSAGAVHPDRGLGWEPRYNIMELSPRTENDRTVLQVRIQARRWHRNEAVFGSDPDLNSQERQQWMLPLNPSVAALSAASAEPLPSPVNLPQESYAVGTENAADQPEPVTVSNRGRRLAYELARLGAVKQAEVGIRLAILNQDERSLPARMLVPLLLGRAAERGKLAELWNVVVTQGVTPAAQNPFLEANG